MFNDTREFISICTIYAIQYSCCKRLIRLWKKDNSNNGFGEKFGRVVRALSLS